MTKYQTYKSLFVMAVLLGSAAHVSAVSITPSLQNFELNPGDRTESEVLIVNTDDERITVVPSVKTWFLLPANKAYKIDDWLKIKSKEEFALEPGESKKLPFSVFAPKKAQGELVGMLSLRTKSASRTTIEFVLSSAVYLAVKGTEKLKGEVIAFTVNPSSDSVTAGVVLRNTGNVHLRPQSILQILDGNGRPFANVELEKGQPTYPGKNRPYLGTVKDLRMKPGVYTAQIELVDFDRNAVIDKRREKFVLTEDYQVKF